MKPVNNKSLLHFIFDQMDKLDTNNITVEQAKAQANLAKQANNALKYEIERSRLLIDISNHKKENEESIIFREAELKNFD